MKAYQIIACSSGIASLFCGFFGRATEKIPPFCVVCPRRFVLPSDLDDLHGARIGTKRN